MLENARLLGDRRLAEEVLERNLLSCKFIRIYSMKTSFPMTRMIDYTLASEADHLSPHCNYDTICWRRRVLGLISNKSCDNSEAARPNGRGFPVG